MIQNSPLCLANKKFPIMSFRLTFSWLHAKHSLGIIACYIISIASVAIIILFGRIDLCVTPDSLSSIKHSLITNVKLTPKKQTLLSLWTKYVLKPCFHTNISLFKVIKGDCVSDLPFFSNLLLLFTISLRLILNKYNHTYYSESSQWANHRPESRNRRSQILFKIGVLKNFAIFTGKRMCWSLFLKKF